MPVRVRLGDGVQFVVKATLEEFTASLRKELERNGLLEVLNDDGKTRVLNPQQILYFEGVEPEADEGMVG